MIWWRGRPVFGGGRSGGGGARDRASSGLQDCLELQEVVGGGDQVDLGLDRGSAASQNAGDRAVMLGSGEHRLDDLLSTPVVALTVRARQLTLHRDGLGGAPCPRIRRGRQPPGPPVVAG